MRNKDTKRHVTVINKNKCQESFDTSIAHRKKMVKNGKKTAGNKKKGDKERETKRPNQQQKGPKWELKSSSQRGLPFQRSFQLQQNSNLNYLGNNMEESTTILQNTASIFATFIYPKHNPNPTELDYFQKRFHVSPPHSHRMSWST